MTDISKTYASIITIGDELLIGQVIDTNSAFIAQELNKNGILVKQRVAVGDDWDDIWNALDEVSKTSKIVIITGGLGPTADDITKPLLCNYFGGKLILDKATLEHIKYLFEKVFKRTTPLLERNKKQAEVPDTCTVLKNEMGTAPGMMFSKNDCLFFALPGVPHEMKWLIVNQVLPILREQFSLGFIEHRTLLTNGVGESALAEMLMNFEAQLPQSIKLAYLPNFGMVRLRLTGFNIQKSILETTINNQFEILKDIVAEILVTDKDEPMEVVVGNLLKAANKTVSTAESCTGGYIAHLLTSSNGASSYYEGSIVSYSYFVKEKVLNVQADTLVHHGAVSEETVIEMAKNTKKILNTNYAIAVSGIMGPDGGTNDKPVGSVWVAVIGDDGIRTKKFTFRFDRIKNIQLTALNALNLLRELIVDKG